MEIFRLKCIYCKVKALQFTIAETFYTYWVLN